MRYKLIIDRIHDSLPNTDPFIFDGMEYQESKRIFESEITKWAAHTIICGGETIFTLIDKDENKIIRRIVISETPITPKKWAVKNKSYEKTTI